MRVSFNWLKDYVDIKVSAEELAGKLTMAGLEVTSLTAVDGDSLMEIEVTPNRADWLGVIGIAREIAAITGKKLKIPGIPALPEETALAAPIQIQAPLLCPRYTGRVIRNARVAPSPAWLARRLEAAGVRPVNNLVDITNFCLLEAGQPLHIFDWDKLRGRRIIVRAARAGEEIVTIDGVKRILDPSILVIADESSPQAVAGIMGGKDSEVSASTVNILLESASFAPLNIHNASRKLGLLTQSSYRFERGVSWEGVAWTSLRAAGLIKELAGPVQQKISFGKLTDMAAKQPPRAKTITLRCAKVNALLGVEIPPQRVKKSLQRLGFSVAQPSKNRLVAKVPAFRADVHGEADLVEEAARLYGYDNIPLRTPAAERFYSGSAELPAETQYSLIRQILSSLGMNEIMSYSLISRQSLERLELAADDSLAVSNPLSCEQEMMRPTLLAGMFCAAQTNVNRKNTNLKLFELSRVYLRKKDVTEAGHLCVALSGGNSGHWLQKGREYSFFDLKGLVEELLARLGVTGVVFQQGETAPFISGRCAHLYIQGELIGALGEIKRAVLQTFDIDSPVYAGEFQVYKLVKYVCLEKKFIPPARFPAVSRDISLIIPVDLPSEQIAAAVKKYGGGLVPRIVLFDQYLGGQIPAGCRGLSYSIEYRSPERTLTAEEVDKLHGEIRRALVSELKAQVR